MIYTVSRGDTLYKIAQSYNTTIEKLIQDNGLTRPNDLVVGQNLIIPSNNPSTYTVVGGDTLFKISNRLGVSINDILKINPQITNPDQIQIGQIINIPNTKQTIEVNGYAIANISESTLSKTLPYLTYLSIFSYQAKSDGSLYILYEDSLITQSRQNSVAPIMVVTNIGDSGGFDSDIANTILTNTQTQNIFINNIISVLNAKNYYGVDIDFEYLYPTDKENYINFLRNLKAQLVANNKTLSVAVAPKYRDNQSGILYEAHDYRAIGEIADRVIIMTYEWGYVYGEPMAISPYSEVNAVLSYAVTRIPSNKILMGMPNYAYDWILPFSPGTSATTLTNTQALELAIDNGAVIKFDTKAQAPYFNYTDASGKLHVVWFEDAKSIQARLSLVSKYNLAGVSYWTINNFNAVNWTVLTDMFNVKKVL